MDWQIRFASTDDAAAISTIVIAALRESNAQDYSPEVIAQVEQSFSSEAILGVLAQRQVYVAIIDNQVVATASLDRDVVRSVFVAPHHQGFGIGRHLIAIIQSAAASAGLTVLRVPSSITAEGFYVKLGFRKVRDEFHGVERTIIMEHEIRSFTRF